MYWLLKIEIVTSRGDILTKSVIPMSHLGSTRCHTICFEQTPIVDEGVCLYGINVTPDVGYVSGYVFDETVVSPEVLNP